jgi:hypothetical protein
LLGICAERIQSGDSAGANFAAGLLGAHRICVRKIFDFAEAGLLDSDGDFRVADYFSFDAGALDIANAIQEKG